ncbi:putative DNA methylase [Erwinia phage Snitter]|nr:putative DNA methylase [Erwinia phage Snitter]
MSKVIFSLFDGSGIMGLKYAENGYQVYCFNADEGNHGEYSIKMQHENLHYVNIWIDNDFDDNRKALGIPDPNMIFGFPDCTFFAQSGSQHERTDGDISTALSNAKMIEALGDKYSCPWMVENPVGKLSTLWRKPDNYFHPFEYGDHLDRYEPTYHAKMPFQDGYTKKTCIWHGNGFVFPEKKPGEVNIGFFWGWKYLGGNSPKTKILRSLTPRGYARAVFSFNK